MRYILDGPEDDDQQDAKFHNGKSPDLQGAKGNGSENKKKKENDFDNSSH